jgi:L-ascorbate metabolism protein UlaG (beta-lactamase superfamily)
LFDIAKPRRRESAVPFPPTDHCDGKTFFNPGAPPVASLRDVIRWKSTSHPVPWPKRVEVVPQPPPAPPAGEGVTATWVGHATFLLQTAAGAVLTDPVFSDRAGPLGLLGPRRAAAPGIRLADLPRVALILLSHDHYDHCDLASLRRLARRDAPVIVTPLGYRPLLRGLGFRAVVELDWWQSHQEPGLAEVTLVPALHWCRRTPFATNNRLWGGHMATLGGRRVYFVGDSGYAEDFFPAVQARCGAPDLALIPIGAYEPRWFMKAAHMDPAEAVRVHQEVGARRSIAMHWGTFQLTDEGREQPVEALAAARGAAAFEVLPFGGSLTI